MSQDQNAERCHVIKSDNSSFVKGGRVHIFGNNLIESEFYLGRIKSRLKLGNACCHLVQNLMSSSVLSKNIKIKIYRTIILPVVLYGCETWWLTLRLRMFENRVLRRIFVIKPEYTNKGHLCLNKSLLCFKPLLFSS